MQGPGERGPALLRCYAAAGKGAYEMTRFLKIAGLALALLLVVAGAAFWAWGVSRHASAAPEALAALESDATVMVEQGEYLVFRPATGTPAMGVILYPGAYCDFRGYAPILRRIAAAGHLVVAVPMPLEMALLAPNRALDVQAAFPATRHWALIGHSLGGVVAAMFVHAHPQAVGGLVLWDSYPTEGATLAEWNHPVWLIHRARPDGSPPKAFAEHRAYFPPDSRWVPMPGGIHMYFGSFDGGGFVEDWPPSIPRAMQHDIAVGATLEALAAMSR